MHKNILKDLLHFLVQELKMQNFFEKKKCYVSIHNVIMHIKEVGKYVFACMNISLMEKYWNRVNVPEKFLKKNGFKIYFSR